MSKSGTGLDEYELNLLQAMVEAYLEDIGRIWPGVTCVISKRPNENGGFINTFGYVHPEYRNLSPLHLTGLTRSGKNDFGQERKAERTFEDEWELGEKVAENFDLTEAARYLQSKGLRVKYDSFEYDALNQAKP